MIKLRADRRATSRPSAFPAQGGGGSTVVGAQGGIPCGTSIRKGTVLPGECPPVSCHCPDPQHLPGKHLPWLSWGCLSVKATPEVGHGWPWRCPGLHGNGEEPDLGRKKVTNTVVAPQGQGRLLRRCVPVIGFSLGGCLGDPEVALIVCRGLRSPKAVVQAAGPAGGQSEAMSPSVSTACRTILF